MIEDDKALVERLRDEDEGGWVLTLCGEAADRIEVLSAENERLKYDGIHSCHDQCERPLCVAWRDNEKLREVLRSLIDNYAPVGEPGYLWPEARAALGETK